MTDEAVDLETALGQNVPLSGGLGTRKTCKDEKELQRRVAINMAAIKSTASYLEEALSENDKEFALVELKNLLAQAKGLVTMINEAKANNFQIIAET